MIRLVRLTLVGRTYCHLCDVLKTALAAEAAGLGVSCDLVEIDLDSRPEWEERFGTLVPLLFLGEADDGKEICHHFFDAARFREMVV